MPKLQKFIKKKKGISLKNVRDCFALVANLATDVLVSKYVAVWQRRTETRRTVRLPQTHISPEDYG